MNDASKGASDQGSMGTILSAPRSQIDYQFRLHAATTLVRKVRSHMRAEGDIPVHFHLAASMVERGGAKCRSSVAHSPSIFPSDAPLSMGYFEQ